MDKYLPKVSKTIKTVTKKNWLRTIEGKASETCFSLDRLSTVQKVEIIILNFIFNRVLSL